MVESRETQPLRKRALARPMLLLGAVALGILLILEQATMLRFFALEASRGWPYTGLLSDFFTWWNTASSVAAGRSPYEWLVEKPQGPEAFDPYVYPYPPLIALLLAPLTQVLDYPTARLAWLAFSVLCLVLSVTLVWRTTGLRIRDPLAVVCCLALLPSATWALYLGQLSPQLLLVTTGAFAALGARRSATAGAFVALGACLKSFPALLGGYFLLRRQWRGCLAAIVVGLILVALSLLVLGWEPHWTYLTKVVPTQRRWWFGLPSDVSITGFFTHLLVDSPFNDPFTTPVVAAETLAQLAIALSVAVLLATSGYAIWHARSDREGEANAYALAVVATLLVAPINANYNLVIALVPLTVAATRVQAAWPRHLRWFLLAVVLMSLPVFPFQLWPVVEYFPPVAGYLPLSQRGWGNLLASGPFFGQVVLWALLLRLCLEPRSLAASEAATR